jgi:hypothetical protein
VSLQFSAQSSPVNKLMVKWPYGYFFVEDAPSQAAHGVFEGMVSIDTEIRAEAVRVARVLLRDIANPRYSVVVGIDPVATNGSDRPYVSFAVGDRVTAPNRTGTPTSYRVLAITVDADDMARPNITLELDTRLNQREAERFKLFQSLGSGVVGNTKVRNALATGGGVSK